MPWPKDLEFHEHFSVTRCQNPDYCYWCDELIKRGQFKVAWKGRGYHKHCLENYSQGKITVNTETMKVQPNVDSDI